MKIFDCFTYYDEDLLLDLRLNILYPYVDKFVIIESKQTDLNEVRELNFKMKNFEKFKDKILYCPIENLTIDKSLKLKKNWSKHHLLDQSRRNKISDYIYGASDNDWIIISDVDEIPNPNVFNKFDIKKKYAFFEQRLFHYKFNLLNSSSPNWYGSRVCQKKFLRSPQWLRDFKIKKDRNIFKKLLFNPQIILNGGWHFNSVRSPKDLIKKFKSFAHADDYKHILDEDIIKDKIERMEVLYDREHELKRVDLDDSFPDYFLKNKQKFAEFII